VRAAGRCGSGLPRQQPRDAALLLKRQEREPFCVRDLPFLVDQSVPDVNLLIQMDNNLLRHDLLGLRRTVGF
jgi:hypothetical protein